MARDDHALSRQLAALVAPAVESAGCDLEDLTARMAGRRRLVTVLVDRDGGVDLDTVAEVSRLVGEVLDGPEADALLSAAYVLEVSSPGVDRPLTLPRHWRRATGRLVQVRTGDGSDVLGRITGVQDAQASLDVDGRERIIAFSEVTRAVVQVEFGRPGPDDESADDESAGAP